MKSVTTRSFRRQFAKLPQGTKQAARATYRLFASNPNHPSLGFKKLPPYPDFYSVRINIRYRAVGRLAADTMYWFFVGTHAQYDRLLD